MIDAAEEIWEEETKSELTECVSEDIVNPVGLCGDQGLAAIDGIVMMYFDRLIDGDFLGLEI